MEEEVDCGGARSVFAATALESNKCLLFGDIVAVRLVILRRLEKSLEESEKRQQS